MALPGMADDRFQTMSLQSAGACTIANKARPACAHESNYVGDIDGAAPELKYMRYTARRPDLYVTKDIEKSSPMKLHARGPQPNPNEWHNNPIEGSKPRETRFKSNRHTDPLAPEYVLPRCKLEKPPTPKFIRDGYTVTDIDGTVPKPLYPLAMRDTYNVHDIEGAQASWRPRHERARRASSGLSPSSAASGASAPTRASGTRPSRRCSRTRRTGASGGLRRRRENSG